MAEKALHPEAQDLKNLLDAVAPLFVEYIDENFDESALVCNMVPPDELRKLIDFSLPDSGLGLDETVKLVSQVLKYSVRTGHPRFFDKLYVGTTPIGIVSELLTAVANTNMHIYNVAPVFTLMELQVVKELGALFGFENADGITCPGGSFSNLMGVICARNTKWPYYKLEGSRGNENMCMFTSVDSHYSFAKAAGVLGIGANRVVKVKSLPDGSMDPEELEKCIEAALSHGQTPFFVNATAGTTVKGAFDPFHDVARICKKYDLWFHIDACWGGGVVFSEEHKNLLSGCEKSDSIAWNPHKMMGLPIQCSVLLMKEKGVLKKSNALGASYLFHDNEYDLGDKTIQCGRRPDIVKLFMTWKYRGAEGFRERMQIAFKNATYFQDIINADDKFRLVCKPTSLNICFWYWPDYVNDLEPEEQSKEITSLTQRIYGELVRRGKVFLDFSPNPRGPKFFRMIINSPNVREYDLDLVLSEIKISAETLAASSA